HPLPEYTRKGDHLTNPADAKDNYQPTKADIELVETPQVYRPVVGEFQISDLNQVFGILADDNIYEAREISKDGAIIVVRPDGYVSTVQPLDATDAIAEFFAGVFIEQN